MGRVHDRGLWIKVVRNHAWSDLSMNADEQVQCLSIDDPVNQFTAAPCPQP